ncbi:hypothetical protein [Secundilactobacillus kimchicus]|uniref:hypothetical protein n=1 Tax=Secundilactobacillus kimchicus TaxID=528209 RepID=UPI0024A90DAE|nr:hypothetical protein [Secundilactobacillus kimchicus]
MAIKKKLTVQSLKGKSTKYLQTKTNQYKAIVKKDAARISSAKEDQLKAEKVIDKTDDYLSKANGYRSKRDAYNDLTSQIEAQEKLLKKTKSKAKQKTAKQKIEKLTKDRKAVAGSIKKLSGTKAFQAELSKRTKAQATVRSAKKRASAWHDVKKKNAKTYSTYKTALARAQAKAKKAKQEKNRKSISKKIKQYKKDHPYGGHTAIWREDLMSDDIFMLSEHSPTESDDQDVPTTTVDKSDPRSNYSVRTSKSLSGTYYMFGKNFEANDKEFRKLETWARLGYRVSVQGFSKLKTCYIQNVTKSMDTAQRNVLPLSITFQYVMVAPITTIKKKSKAKTKPKTEPTPYWSPKLGSNKPMKIVIPHAGESVYEVAKKVEQSYSDIYAMNKNYNGSSLEIEVPSA